MTTISITFDADVAESVVKGKTYQAKLAEIPAASLAKIFAYGFQRIVNDKCGGADLTDEKRDELARAQIARILDGSIVHHARTAAEREPAINYYIREVLRKRMGDETRKAYKACEADDRAAFLMARYEALPEASRTAITALAQAMLDEALASASRVKKIDVTI